MASLMTPDSVDDGYKAGHDTDDALADKAA